MILAKISENCFHLDDFIRCHLGVRIRKSPLIILVLFIIEPLMPRYDRQSEPFPQPKIERLLKF